MAKSKKSDLIRKLKERGIKVPKKATVAQLKGLLNNQFTGKGWLFSLAVPASRCPDPNHPIHHCIMETIYYIPDCAAARAIMETQLAFPLGRPTEKPNRSTALEGLTGWTPNGN